MSNTIKIVIIIALIWFVFRLFTKKSNDRTANTGNPYPWGGGSSGGNNSGGTDNTPETWSNLSPAVTECIGGLMHYRQISNKGNYRWLASGVTCEVSPPQNTNLKSIPDYPKPSTLNREVFAQFPELNLPTNFISVGGYGFALYGDTALDANGKVKLFKQGYTNVINLHGLNKSKFSTGNKTDNYYYFQQLYHLAKEASKGMRSNYNPAWGTLDSRDNDPHIEDYDYSGLTIAGAKAMGARMTLSTNSLDNLNAWDIDATSSVLMIDEESIGHRSWAGGGHHDFIGYVIQGISEATGGKQKIFLYAQSITDWFKNEGRHARFDELTDAELESALNPSNINFNSLNGVKWFIDANGGYYKTPFLHNKKLYKTGGDGKPLVVNGKRVYRDDADTISLFQSPNVPILVRPDNQMAWHGKRANGTEFWGWQNEWGAVGSVNMTNALPSGWSWGANARPNPADWRTDYQYFVENIYNKADAVMQDLLMLARKEKGVFNISTPNVYNQMYVELRDVTEPWTTHGNYIWPRELGNGMIFYDTLLAIYSGAKAISTWNDGRYTHELSTNGNPLYWADIEHKDGNGNVTHYTREYINADWTRYHARLSAVQEALKPLQGTDCMTWTHIHFYQPYFGRKNSEVISSGVYHAGKLDVFFLNPTLEAGEEQNLTLAAGSAVYGVKLVGHEVYYQTFDVQTGLSPEQFTLEYTTIYGKQTKVTGKVTNNRSEHYLKG